MPRHLQRAIDRLMEHLIALSAKVEENVRFSIHSLDEMDRDMAQQVIERDEEIDKKEIEIEEIPEKPQEISPGKIDTKIKTIPPTPDKPIIVKKTSKFKLEDIPGVGDKKVELLKKANITTIEELISCSPKTIAKEVKGLGEVSLNKWKQKAKQIIND